ncbi:MAG: SDR family NAD(P)-dependent oxidoreductase [Betaproteobacteria bacterium]
MPELQGKAVIVTGASRGIGRATACAFAQAGASLYLAADGPKEELEAATEACRNDNRKGLIACGLFDLSDAEAPARMVSTALDVLKRIDVLVNNAGIRIRHPFGEYAAAEFDKLIAINVRAAFLASQAVLPAMRAQGGGRIIHVASQMGLVAHHDSLLYGLSKAAVIYLAQAMAYELAKDHIIVNAVSPGPIMTEYNKERTAQNPALLKDRLGYLPIGRYGEPEEVARTIVLLASATPEFLQGHNLVIDGGYTAH